MKRSFNSYLTDNIPDYIIKLCDSIKNNQIISIYLPKEIGDEIKDPDYFIYFLNRYLNDYEIIKIHQTNICLSIKKNNIIFKIDFEFNSKKQIYRLKTSL